MATVQELNEQNEKWLNGKIKHRCEHCCKESVTFRQRMERFTLFDEEFWEPGIIRGRCADHPFGDFTSDDTGYEVNVDIGDHEHG